ncbi:helix-turn-helix domain-containing protein [Halodesulfovibrio aestuarii]|uniref:Helix-turn-helix domain-containing protein n=1 Tax=Halodesulfovibrio aestuarii TaxID=126333 RepID=A0ABV4JPT7_9BACT
MTHSTILMVKYDPENAQAWAIIMNKIRQEYAEGNTQLSIAQKLGVTKVAVSRWLSEDRGGERTTFGDMLRYAKALGIPYNELIDMPCQANQLETTSFDKALATILTQAVADADLTAAELARQTGLPESQLTDILTGNIPATGAALHKICTVVEVGASILLRKADKLMQKGLK